MDNPKPQLSPPPPILSKETYAHGKRSAYHRVPESLPPARLLKINRCFAVVRSASGLDGLTVLTMLIRLYKRLAQRVVVATIVVKSAGRLFLAPECSPP